MEVTRILMTVKIKDEQQVEAVAEALHAPENMQYQHPSYGGALNEESDQAPAESEREEKAQPFVRQSGKVGRNSPCPCGSGKKYKSCHGKIK